MKILFVSPYFPLPEDEGGKIRIFNLIKNLAVYHEIHFFSLIYEESEHALIPKLKKYCKRIELVLHKPLPRHNTFFSKLKRAFFSLPDLITKRYNFDLKQLVDKACSEENYDIIQAEQLYAVQYLLDKDLNKIILSEHNIESEIFERYVEVAKDISELQISRWSWRNKLEIWKLKRYENFVWEKIKHILIVSDRDKKVIDHQVKNRATKVIPNGVNINFFNKKSETEIKPMNYNKEDLILLYTGSFSHYPNTDAILFFYHNIFDKIYEKYPNVKLYVVGKNPYPSLIKLNKDNRVVVTGYVEDVRPYIQISDIFIVPLRIGGGSRLKILQAMSMEKCIISTTLGAEGIECEDHKNIMIADEPEDFVEKIKVIIENKELKSNIEENARQLVNEYYSWETIAKHLHDYYCDYFLCQKNE